MEKSDHAECCSPILKEALFNAYRTSIDARCSKMAKSCESASMIVIFMNEPFYALSRSFFPWRRLSRLAAASR